MNLDRASDVAYTSEMRMWIVDETIWVGAATIEDVFEILTTADRVPSSNTNGDRAMRHRYVIELIAPDVELPRFADAELRLRPRSVAMGNPVTFGWNDRD